MMQFTRYPITFPNNWTFHGKDSRGTSAWTIGKKRKWIITQNADRQAWLTTSAGAVYGPFNGACQAGNYASQLMKGN